MTDAQIVHTEVFGDFATIRIERAEKRNAMNRKAREELRQALAELTGGPRAILITGTGESFCAGMDLKEDGSDPELRKQGAAEWVQTLLDIRRHPAIVISAVNGLALGGGVSLINASDLSICAHEAQIGMPEMGFAMYPAMAAPTTQFMLQPKRAAWMVLTAKRIDGRTAERWGLVCQSVPRSDLESVSLDLARHVSQFDATALTESKRALEMIPNRINDWTTAFDHGQLVNQSIRSRSSGQKAGLLKFAQGQANVGQGLDPV